jgi:ATP synthase protein I
MNEAPGPRRDDSALARLIGVKAARKLKARRDPAPGVWFGLGMMGLIGWSVSVPALLGVALGAWLDSHYPGQHNWTLALLVAGLTLGCFNAWHWVAKEDRAMHASGDDKQQPEETHDE